jgi:hypothetical protein
MGKQFIFGEDCDVLWVISWRATEDKW